VHNAAFLGPTIRIKGEVTTGEPLSIAGQVDGSIDASGHPVTICSGAHLTASVSAHTIIVEGSINGTLVGTERIVIRDSAHVQGDICAPTVSLAEGAAIDGRVETTKRATALSLAS
jgi:cytoskeletal protein CcmA (bactofilin family)